MQTVPPAINARILRYFGKYARWTLRRSFHSVRADGFDGLLALHDRPLVVYSNHPSWWDPLFCLCLRQRFLPDHRVYAPIDARALERYGFFTKLGFFGVEQGTLAGAKAFRRTATAILQTPRAALWITPEGALTDPRKRPVTLQGGIAHLAKAIPEAVFLPVAMEYPFGMERQPEALAVAGEPIEGHDISERLPVEASAVLAARLEAAMNRLAAIAVAGQFDQLPELLSGRAGTDVFWDLWLRAKALVTGQRYAPEHASVTHSS